MSQIADKLFTKKTILLIMHYGSLGGAERQGLGLSKILTEDFNCEVYLLLTHSHEMHNDFEQFAKECHIRDIFHTHSPYVYIKKEISYKNLKRLVWTFKYFWSYRKLLKPYKFDYIFPFLNLPSKVAFYLYKMLPTVKFTFWHQLGLDVFKKDLTEKYAAKNVPVVIANSSTGLSLFREYHKLDNSRAFILPQYLTMEYRKFDRKSLLQKYEISLNSVVFGMVAHYREDKKHYLILEAYKKLLKSYPNSHLVFVGNRDSSPATELKFDALQKFLIENNLEKNVKLLSQQPIQEVLAILDVGLLISQIEGMPNAVMEYMLYNLPVIASNHPGCVQLLGDSEYLIKNDVEVIYNKMYKLSADESLRMEIGENNRKRIKHFSKEKYMEDLAQIIKLNK